MALGKTIAEVHSLSAEEFSAWQTYYLLEPWGWHDREYRTAALMAMLVNVNVAKRRDQKQPKDFMRDMEKEIGKAYMQIEREIETSERYQTASKEERIRLIAQSMGASIKDGKLGNGSDNSGKINS